MTINYTYLLCSVIFEGLKFHGGASLEWFFGDNEYNQFHAQQSMKFTSLKNYHIYEPV